MNMSEATTNVEENSDSNREHWPTEATQPAALNQIQMRLGCSNLRWRPQHQ